MAVGERFGHISDAELDELVSYIEREVKFYHILRERGQVLSIHWPRKIFFGVPSLPLISLIIIEWRPVGLLLKRFPPCPFAVSMRPWNLNVILNLHGKKFETLLYGLCISCFSLL